MIQSATERRVVSILFVDLVGFTALVAGRDPEDVGSLQDRYFATARSIVGRYGGTIEKFIGDAVMALWGAPIAHEDDPARAVRAGLDLVEAVGSLHLDENGPALQARAGAMTGEAVVRLNQADQGIVSGELVNSASRLQADAQPGTVLVDEPTRRAADAIIAFETAGSRKLRGQPSQLHTWRALHVVALKRGGGVSPRLAAPFVGRESELRLLKELLHTTASQSRAHLVSLIGVSGIGKTRLAWELEKYVDGIAEQIVWLQGRSPAYGDGITFWALGEMIRSRAGIAEGEDPGITRERFDQMLDADLGNDPDERRHLAKGIGALLDLESVGDVATETLFYVWRTFLARIAERRPLVLVFEDAQWADLGLLDFIESILEWSRSLPILILTLARPELLERRSTWGAGSNNFTRLHLDPLPDAAMQALLGGLGPGISRPLRRRIVDRAAGVPLFAIETVRMLIDGGQLVLDDGRVSAEGNVGRLEVPESLRGLIGARLDALGPDDRALLQHAAILGQSFTLEGMEALTGRSTEELRPRLEALVHRDLLAINLDPRSPERGQVVFLQALIREVAYQRLSKRERRSRHLAAARYFESIGSDELAGFVANHYYDAYVSSSGAEASVLAGQARGSLRAAADRASKLGSHDQALGYLETSITLAVDTTERAALWEMAAEAAQWAARSDRAEHYGRAAAEYYRAGGDLVGLARATARLGRGQLTSHETEKAIMEMDRVLGEVADISQEPEAIALLAERARAAMMTEDPVAFDLANRALEAAGNLALVPVVAEALITKAAVLNRRGRELEAMALVRGAADLAESHGLQWTLSRAAGNFAAGLIQDVPQEAVAQLGAFRDLCVRMGNREQYLWATQLLGNLHFWAGAWGLVDQICDDLEESDLPPHAREGVLALRAIVASGRGEIERGRELRAEAEAAAPEVTRPEWVAGRLEDRAVIDLFAGDLASSYDGFMASADITEGLWAPALAARIASFMHDPDRARVALEAVRRIPLHGRYVGAFRLELEACVDALEGRSAEAIAGFVEAARLFRDLEQPLALGFSQMEFAMLLGPSEPAAAPAAEKARATFTRIGSPPLIALLGSGLAWWDQSARSRPASFRA